MFLLFKIGNRSKGYQKDCFYLFFLVLSKGRAYAEILSHKYSATQSRTGTPFLNYMHKADLLHCDAGSFDIFEPKIFELLPYRSLVQLYVFHKNYERQKQIIQPPNSNSTLIDLFKILHRAFNRPNAHSVWFRVDLITLLNSECFASITVEYSFIIFGSNG